MRDDNSVVRSGDMGCPDTMRAANAIWAAGTHREGRARALRWLGWLVAVAVVVAALTIACDARAQFAPGQKCGNRGMFLQRLKEHYQEVPSFFGIDSNGAVIEVLVSPWGTWTVLVTKPGRPTCAVAAGKSWEALPSIEAGEPS